MSKVKFFSDNGANIHSKRYEVFDIVEDFGLTMEEWNSYTEDDKSQMAWEWAIEHLDAWVEEVA